MDIYFEEFRKDLKYIYESKQAQKKIGLELIDRIEGMENYVLHSPAKNKEEFYNIVNDLGDILKAKVDFYLEVGEIGVLLATALTSLIDRERKRIQNNIEKG